MTSHSELRAHLLEVLRGGHAHVTFDDAVAGLPASLRGTRPDQLPYSPWELIEHIRISQRDILDYTVAPDAASYKETPWPEGHWPKTQAPPSAKAWDDSIATIRADREEMERLVQNDDLFGAVPASKGTHTLLREAMMLADHNSYHIGEIVAVRRLLGAWR